MQHNAPHRFARFEGYYSKFDLPAGGHIALVLCQVKRAKERPYMVSFTYVPPGGGDIFQREIWADEMQMIRGPKSTFKINVPKIGYIDFGLDSQIDYHLVHDDFTLQGSTTSHTPWSRTCHTPEGILVYLPLPLHWHVQTLASPCTYNLTIPSRPDLPTSDLSGTALVHQEKNWAYSFPSAHIWLQARSTTSSFCCAGGQILGLEAFLLGYRSVDVNVDFRPPWAVRFVVPWLGWSWGPTMWYRSDWEERKFELRVRGWRREVRVRAQAPRGTFFSLSSPFVEGHRENMLGQSFRATLEVEVWEAGWIWGGWRVVKRDRFEGASLEFGGGYYPPAGSEKRFH